MLIFKKYYLIGDEIFIFVLHIVRKIQKHDLRLEISMKRWQNILQISKDKHNKKYIIG